MLGKFQISEVEEFQSVIGGIYSIYKTSRGQLYERWIARYPPDSDFFSHRRNALKAIKLLISNL